MLTVFEDKVVLVTGGAKGIGRMISEGFVANGAKVYISSRDVKACEKACKELNALGTCSSLPLISVPTPSLIPTSPSRQRQRTRHPGRFLQA